MTMATAAERSFISAATPLTCFHRLSNSSSSSSNASSRVCVKAFNWEKLKIGHCNCNCRSRTLPVPVIINISCSSSSSSSSSSPPNRNSNRSRGSVAPILLERPSLASRRRPEAEEHEENDGQSLFSSDEVGPEPRWIDWEDEILGETQPLLGLVRSILHSNWYECGERLKPDHEKIIFDRLLPYHPEFEEKIGSGVDFISVDYHPEFENSRCLFVNRRDGKVVDFSFWKCLRGLVWTKYPLFAEVFIKKHLTFRKL